MVSAIINSKAANDQVANSLFKLKNSLWNKIISNQEFNRLQESEYLKWQEIYKDSSNIFKLNPVTLEQKLALIEVINAKTLKTTEKKISTLKNEIEKLDALKLRKLALHLKKMDLSYKITREDLTEFSADLFIILKGPPASLMDYFTKNKSKAMNERLFRTVQEDMLVMGLKGMLSRIPEKESYTRMENARFMVKKFFAMKGWKYVVIPYDLPWFEKLRIPEDLLERILIDGLATHNEELITHLKSQNMIDHYERFRKVYRPVAFSLGFAYYYQKFDEKFDEQIKSNEEEEKQKLLKSFNTLNNVINENYKPENVSEIKLKEEQHQRHIDKFRIDYGEESTPEELIDLKNKINN